jgi:hypothetical protein
MSEYQSSTAAGVLRYILYWGMNNNSRLELTLQEERQKTLKMQITK